MPIFLGDIPLEQNSSLDNQEKLFLLGARTQGEDVETYSQNQVYAQGGILYSEGKKVATQEYVDIRVPAWTEDDEGKILRIVNGTPVWVSIPNAEEVAF